MSSIQDRIRSLQRESTSQPAVPSVLGARVVAASRAFSKDDPKDPVLENMPSLADRLSCFASEPSTGERQDAGQASRPTSISKAMSLFESTSGDGRGQDIPDSPVVCKEDRKARKITAQENQLGMDTFAVKSAVTDIQSPDVTSIRSSRGSEDSTPQKSPVPAVSKYESAIPSIEAHAGSPLNGLSLRSARDSETNGPSRGNTAGSTVSPFVDMQVALDKSVTTAVSSSWPRASPVSEVVKLGTGFEIKPSLSFISRPNLYNSSDLIDAETDDTVVTKDRQDRAELTFPERLRGSPVQNPAIAVQKDAASESQERLRSPVHLTEQDSSAGTGEKERALTNAGISRPHSGNGAAKQRIADISKRALIFESPVPRSSSKNLETSDRRRNELVSLPQGQQAIPNSTTSVARHTPEVSRGDSAQTDVAGKNRAPVTSREATSFVNAPADSQGTERSETLDFAKRASIFGQCVERDDTLSRSPVIQCTDKNECDGETMVKRSADFEASSAPVVSTVARVEGTSRDPVAIERKGSSGSAAESFQGPESANASSENLQSDRNVDFHGSVASPASSVRPGSGLGTPVITADSLSPRHSPSPLVMSRQLQFDAALGGAPRESSAKSLPTTSNTESNAADLPKVRWTSLASSPIVSPVTEGGESGSSHSVLTPDKKASRRSSIADRASLFGATSVANVPAEAPQNPKLPVGKTGTESMERVNVTAADDVPMNEARSKLDTKPAISTVASDYLSCVSQSRTGDPRNGSQPTSTKISSSLATRANVYESNSGQGSTARTSSCYATAVSEFAVDEAKSSRFASMPFAEARGSSTDASSVAARASRFSTREEAGSNLAAPGVSASTSEASVGAMATPPFAMKPSPSQPTSGLLAARASVFMKMEESDSAEKGRETASKPSGPTAQSDRLTRNSSVAVYTKDSSQLQARNVVIPEVGSIVENGGLEELQRMNGELVSALLQLTKAFSDLEESKEGLLERIARLENVSERCQK